MTALNIAEAKAKLSQLVDESLDGGTVTLMRRGKPVARIVPIETPKQPIDIEWLRSVAAALPYQNEGAGDFIRRMRDDERY